MVFTSIFQQEGTMRSSNLLFLRTLGSLLLVLSLFITTAKGGCEFPTQWSGQWFQSGVPNLIKVNSTYIEHKGKCVESDKDKFLIYDESDDCYRCVVINQKHASVLQYKETFCETKKSLQEACYAITGDAPLFSMFRSQPEAPPVACPFKGAPFTFFYNRGSGECSNPPSRAESCTDDSRLVLKYQACPDVYGTESNVEQLICLAVWKEGSMRYLVGKVLQHDRRSTVPSDENQYRCFVYERVAHPGRGVTYNVAQSGDATCNGLQSAQEGSRTIKLTTVDDHHNRCRFPDWLTAHHTWHSLDHRLSYRFSQRNATLLVKGDETGGAPTSAHLHAQYGSDPVLDTHYLHDSPLHAAHTAGGGGGHHDASEARLVCHSILQAQEKKKVQIVAHVTTGCKSGHVCMVFYKRDSSVIEVQRSEKYEENPDEACRYFDPITTPFTTLITAASQNPKKCPHLGRYSVMNPGSIDRRKRRQNAGLDSLSSTTQECLSPTYESVAIGCSGSHDTIEVKSSCAQSPMTSTSAYSCHGSWEENGTSYLIASPIAKKSTDPYRYCFIYNFMGGIGNEPGGQLHVLGTSAPSSGISHSNGKNSNPNAHQKRVLQLSAVADNCHRMIVAETNRAWVFNLTSNGTCADSDDNANLAAKLLIPTAVFLLSLITCVVVIR